MYALIYAFAWAFSLTGIMAGITFATTRNKVRSLLVALATFLPSFTVIFLCQYFLIVEAGYLSGYSYLIWATTIGALAGSGMSWVLEGESRDSGGVRLTNQYIAWGSLAVLILMISGYGLTGAYNFLGPTNHTNWANLGNIQVAAHDQKDLLPETDAAEVLMMNLDTAYNRAHTAIGSTGNNLGSRYQINKDDGVQQTVAGKNYFVFPLELNGWMEQVGWLTEKVDYSAGYIAVPADDPTGKIKIVDNLHIKYTPGMFFGSNLMRHIYKNGYKHGSLDQPTIELDNNWNVYFTVTYVQPAFVVGGHKAVKTLIVDGTTGAITAYDIDKTPTWIDRVISGKLVDQYVKYFGLYHTTNTWFNSNGNGQMKADRRVLVYSSAKTAVWMVTMTSNSKSDSSSTGVILYDTRRQQGTFYPGAAGLALEETLLGSFAKVNGVTQKYDVSEAIQFYQIRGVKTWVAIYSVDHGEAGKSFAGIGFLDAENANATDVRFGINKTQALESYYAYLATRGGAHDSIVGTVSKETVTGKILRIGHSPSNSEVIYTIVLVGDSRIYTVPSLASKLLPVVHEGDSVTLIFDEPLEAKTNSRQVDKFTDLTLAEMMN